MKYGLAAANTVRAKTKRAGYEASLLLSGLSVRNEIKAKIEPNATEKKIVSESGTAEIARVSPASFTTSLESTQSLITLGRRSNTWWNINQKPLNARQKNRSLGLKRPVTDYRKL